MTAVLLDTEVDASVDSSSWDRPVSWRWLVWPVMVVAALLLIRGFAAEPARVRSVSMLPTLRPGSVLLVDKLSYRFRAPRRAELVIARDPLSGESVVKRVVAIAGDSVGIDDGALTVNGARVVEPYADHGNMAGAFYGPELVPAGHVYLLGDNRDDSTDSRAYGPVPVDDLDGRVSGTIWSAG
jgi:signal peptidase I